jgi:hypothetical protein
LAIAAAEPSPSTISVSSSKPLTEPQLAIVFFKESVNQYEAIRGDILGLATEDQQAFTDSVADTYRKLADLLLQQDRILEAQRVLDLLKVQELDEYLDGVRSTAATQRGVDTLGAERQIASRTVLGGYELAQLRQIPVSDLSEAQRQRLAELDTAQRQVIRDFRTFIASPEIQALVAQLETDIQQDLLTELDQFINLQNDLATIQRETGQTAVMVYPLILDDRLGTGADHPLQRAQPLPGARGQSRTQRRHSRLSPSPRRPQQRPPPPGPAALPLAGGAHGR